MSVVSHSKEISNMKYFITNIFVWHTTLSTQEFNNIQHGVSIHNKWLDENIDYCSYKTISLSIGPVSAVFYPYFYYANEKG